MATPSSRTVTALVSMLDGTVVPDGNVAVIVSPLARAFDPPSENEMSYCATTLAIVGLGVTLAALTVADVAIV